MKRILTPITAVIAAMLPAMAIPAQAAGDHGAPKAGDRIKFKALSDAGTVTVTEIQAAH